MKDSSPARPGLNIEAVLVTWFLLQHQTLHSARLTNPVLAVYTHTPYFRSDSGFSCSTGSGNPQNLGNRSTLPEHTFVMPARFTRENEVVYCGDTRYPGPAYYPAPPEITGTPSQAELDAHPRLFTWGELKEIIRE
jgi:hypothetical protein